MHDQSHRGPLSGKRVLVVEDEYMIAELVMDAIEQSGAVVVGPASTLDKALALANSESLDCAILDINLRGQLSYPVADALQKRGVPFLFATGYDSQAIQERYSHVTRCEKPIPTLTLIDALNAL